jgi:aerobic-type carbon monoxide dehydrogenase small subunit (CoxS/CutS family)
MNPGKVMFHLTVNGQDRALSDDIDPATPLLWVLRDNLGLAGTKYGCGGGFCGACTVHLGNSAVRSCQVPVSAVGAKPITTIEGLAEADGKLHPLQEAWLDYDVPQCGYCQAGQLMSASALLKVHPSPTDAQIDAAMDGNFCRCGCYNRIKAAILAAVGKVRTAEPAVRSAMDGEPSARA